MSELFKTRIPMVHIQPSKIRDDVLEFILMVDQSTTSYFMTQEEIKAFSENILEELEHSKIVIDPEQTSRLSQQLRKEPWSKEKDKGKSGEWKTVKSKEKRIDE